jgi:hypothetical protein
MNMASSSKQLAGIKITKAADVIDIDALMHANVARVFNERNADRRRAALTELYAKDATLYDPEGVATGQEAISGAIDQLLQTLPPDFVFTAAGQAVGHNGAARLFWQVGPPNGPVAITGTDVALLEEGRINRLYVFVDPGAR